MRVVRRGLGWALGLTLAVVTAVHAQSGEPPADTGGGPIPLAEVAARAAEIRSLLETQDTAITPSREVQAVLDRLPALTDELRVRLDQTATRLGTNPPLPVVEQLGSMWEATRARLKSWNETVTQWTTRVEQERGRLASLRESWTRSREAAAVSGAPKVVLDQIDGVVSGLNAARGRLESRLSALLATQYRLALLQRRCDEGLSRVAQVRADRIRRLGERDGPPLWSGVLWKGAMSQTRAAAGNVLEAEQAVVGEVAREHATRIPLHALVFAVLVAALWRGRRAARRWVADDPSAASVAEVWSRPISSALVLACFAAPWMYPEATPLLGRVVALIAIVPVLRLIRPSLDRVLAAALYVFGVLFLVDAVRSVLSTAPLFEHMLFLAEMLVASLVMIRLLTSARRAAPLPEPGAPAEADTRAEADAPAEADTDVMAAAARRLVGRLLLAAFAGAFALAGTGYVELGRLVGAGALGSSYYGLAILAAVQVARGLTGVLLRSRIFALLASVQQNRAVIERRISRVLRWAGVIAWIAATLDALTLLSAAVRGTRAALAAQWGWGAIRISLGDMVVFGLTIWLAFVAAAALRLVLAEDVFPRVRMARGVPLALSAVIQYVVIFGGFTLALAALGVDLTKLTILASAFGVGAGLGLQTVVNNFASGLILLFERPIHLGDVVQVAGIGGEVRHIGVRATLVRTADGAEVFVPNSLLIAQSVTNWTYSDMRRRIVLPVRVAYGATPQRVTELLTAIGARHPQVSAEPAAAAVFMGFGENSLDFELRAWTDRFGDAETIQSQLADSVYAALNEARIDLPVPRRDVRLRQVAAEPGKD
ncbi:MAG TPA: mechanosensitive ion channel domain-containing protein [Methylomirabilota bacterium]|nr:mechanosensitive ion channel domain-containing protein [Methylomirabilota bacterium]